MDESSILIIGANGQLGRALQVKYPRAKKVDLDDLDITDKRAVLSYDWSDIKTIFNAAAYTNVDGAETAEGRVLAWKANALAVAYLSEIANKQGIVLFHISTDYVFDGSKDKHLEDEALSPLSIYGASKAAGDVVMSTVSKHYILRTSWVIGDGKNIVRTFLELGKKGVSPSVVNDQVGRLTFTGELVKAIDHLLTNACEYGTYNISNDGEPTSWADVARAVYKQAAFNLEVTNTTTKEYFADKPEAAKRPLLSTLDLSKIKGTGFKPTDWAVDLEKYLAKELS